MLQMVPEQNADDSLDRTLTQAAGGDPQAWRRLVESYSPRVFGLMFRQCGDRDLAEELTQATFVRVVTHLGKYQEQGRFEPWLFRIAMNHLRDEMRRRKRQARSMDMSPASERADADGDGNGEWGGVQAQLTDDADATDPLSAMSREEQIQGVRDAVAQLGEADREILYMRHTAGLTFTQIAESLEQPLGTVLARAHRAVAKLKKLLKDQA